MLPVTQGEKATLTQIIVYSLILAATAMTPFAVGYSGLFYAAGAAVLNLVFIALAIMLAFAKPAQRHRMAMILFAWSIFYLFLIFALLMADRLVA